MSQESRSDRPRRVRSFVIREGRFTPSQRRNLERHWPQLGFEPGTELSTVFGRSAPLVVEVGFGMGDSLFETAQLEPDRNFLGVEVHRPGVGHLLGLAGAAGLINLRVAVADVHTVLAGLPASSVEVVQVFFPDPWPKKRHHKNRLISDKFPPLAEHLLRESGIVYLRTDNTEYFEQMLEVFNAAEGYETAETPESIKRVITDFEQEFNAQGIPTCYAAFRKARG